MEILAVSLVVSCAYVYAPILRIHAARALHMQMPEGAVAPGAGAIATPQPPLPKAIEQFCAAESEPWAQLQGRERARALYAQLHNWDAVMVALQKEA